ncbi:MAG TPA: hypothetical protein VN372_13520 [Methanospirillum sp.]|nr:hypothetical protein [Methanospirillum sp.]
MNQYVCICLSLTCLMLISGTGLVMAEKTAMPNGTNNQSQDIFSLDLNLNQTEREFNTTHQFNLTGNTKELANQSQQGYASPHSNQVTGVYGAISSNTEHPQENSEVRLSTPNGDPLLRRYALAAVAVDFNVHLMEGSTENPNQTASELVLNDHTGVNGYIGTLQKSIHYIDGVQVP